MAYKKQDKKAGREDYDLTVDDVRMIFAVCNMCSRCYSRVTSDNWTLNRIDNTKPHTSENLDLMCKQCNVTNKDVRKEYLCGTVRLI